MGLGWNLPRRIAKFGRLKSLVDRFVLELHRFFGVSVCYRVETEIDTVVQNLYKSKPNPTSKHQNFGSVFKSSVRFFGVGEKMPSPSRNYGSRLVRACGDAERAPELCTGSAMEGQGGADRQPEVGRVAGWWPS